MSVELSALADVLSERCVAGVLLMLEQRLDTAMQRFCRTDNRERMPMEDDFDEPPSPPPTSEASPARPAEVPEEVDDTRDTPPSSDPPKR